MKEGRGFSAAGAWEMSLFCDWLLIICRIISFENVLSLATCVPARIRILYVS